MGKKEDMLKQLQSERQNLPGGLQTLIRGSEEKPQAVQKDDVKVPLASEKEEEKVKVGRPKSNFNDFHTSLVIDHDLYIQIKRIALEQGGRSLKDIIHEALIGWVNVNK